MAFTVSVEIVKKDYSKRIILSLADFKEKGHLLQTVTIPANTKQRKHFHHKQTEVFYILEGETIINITVFVMPCHTNDDGPAFTRAAPIMPPIRA